MVKKFAIAMSTMAFASLAAVLVLRLLYLHLFGDFMFGPGVNDFSARLPGDRYLHHTSAINILIIGPSGVEVPPTVEWLACDARFILAKQQQLRPRWEGDDPGEPIPGKFSYWIVDIAGAQRYGPLDETQFAAKRVELQVDPSLSLRDEASFDPRTHSVSSPIPPSR